MVTSKNKLTWVKKLNLFNFSFSKHFNTSLFKLKFEPSPNPFYSSHHRHPLWRLKTHLLTDLGQVRPRPSLTIFFPLPVICCLWRISNCEQLVDTSPRRLSWPPYSVAGTGPPLHLQELICQASLLPLDHRSNSTKGSNITAKKGDVSSD